MKLNDYLLLLSSAEHIRFRKMLVSPFFGESDNLVCFYDSIRKIENAEKNASIDLLAETTKQAIWKGAFGKKAFSETQYRLWCSDLTLKIQHFLVQLELENKTANNENQSDFLLLNALKTRNASKLFAQIARKIKTCNEENTTKNAAFYLNNFHLEELVNSELEKNKQRDATPRIAEASANLDFFYIAQKLRHACDAINLRNVLKLELELRHITEIKNLAQQPVFAENGLIKTLFMALLMLENTEEIAHFQNFIDLVKTNKQIFEQKELRDFFTLGLNYCIKKINTGDGIFYAKIFDLYEELLQTKAIFIENKLPAWDYKNIITVGLRLGKYDWVERFLYDYNELLPSDFKQNALTYNLAKLEFAKKNYKKVIQLLQTVEYNDIFYSLDSRTTLIKTYYELDEYEALDSNLESFRIFLLRNKTISGFTKKQYENFIRWMRKVMQAPSNRKAIVALREKLEETEIVADKQWLLKLLE